MNTFALRNVIIQNKSRIFFAFAGLVLLGNMLAFSNLQWFGETKAPEWPFAFDFLIMLPVIYLLIHGPKKRESWLGAAAVASCGIFVGVWLLPAESKHIWLWLEPMRYILISMAVGVQFLLLIQIIRDAQIDSASMHVEDKLALAVERRLGKGFFSNAIRFESRVWLYAFGRKSIAGSFGEGQHFSTHQQNGNASNQQGFLILIAAEIPLAHFVIYLFSPMAALTVTVLSLYGMIFLVAEYRATLRRPITVTSDTLRIRYGVIDDFSISISDIISAEHFSGLSRRATGRIRCIGAGAANVRLQLLPNTLLKTIFGEKIVHELLIGVDDVNGFLNAINNHKNTVKA